MTLDQLDGWPPNGEPGLLYGFDDYGNTTLLRWHKGEWYGVRWNMTSKPPFPETFKRQSATEALVKKWARAPS